MRGKGRGAKGSGGGHGHARRDESWTHAAARRFEDHRAGMPEPVAGKGHGGTGSAGEAARRFARELHLGEQRARGEVIDQGVWAPPDEGPGADREPVARVSTSAAREVASTYHRWSGGLLASDFEPQRHSLMVLGRPVQAPLLNPQKDKNVLL